MDLDFYICPVCGKLHVAPEGMGTYPCCGQMPQRISLSNGEGAPEKHVPVIRYMREGCTIEVGEVAHPMQEDHYISNIVLLTEQGYWNNELSWDEAPTSSFSLPNGDRVVCAYAYCNKHGLWAGYPDASVNEISM